MRVNFCVFLVIVYVIGVISVEVYENIDEGPPTNETITDSSEKVIATEKSTSNNEADSKKIKVENVNKTTSESFLNGLNRNTSPAKLKTEHLPKKKTEKFKQGFIRQDDNLPKTSNNREKIFGREKFVEEHLQQMFIPSPEVKPKSSPNFDSFQPVEHPYMIMKKQLSTSTTILPIERTTNFHDDKYVVDFPRSKTILREQNYESQSNGNVWPQTPVESRPRGHSAGEWKIVESEERPETKILNFQQPEFSHEPERDVGLHDMSLVSVSGDHPYPFEQIKQDDLRWFEPPPRVQEENEYEDHNFKNIPSPRPYPVHADSSRQMWKSAHAAGKEIVKPNPLHSILHVLSAVVPIGLLLSALTPNVVVINPNATNTFSRTPPNLNVFGSKQRSLGKSTTFTESNQRDAINKLIEAVQNPQLDLDCTKRSICQVLSLFKEADKADLQKTISAIRKGNHAKVSEVNVSLGELLEAAKEDMCSIYTCKMTKAKSN